MQILGDAVGMDHRAKVDVVDLGDGTDVPGDDLVGLAVLLALELEHMADADALAAVAHLGLEIMTDVSLMNTEDR